MSMRSCVAAVALIGLAAATAPAAVITGTPVSSPTIPANLSEAGKLDWADWNSSSTSGVTSMAPTHRMAGGAGIISDATAVAGNGQVRGSTTNTDIRVAFNNGVGGTSTSSQSLTGVFNHQINTVDAGVQLDVTLPSPGEYAISVWVSGYNGRGTFIATTLSDDSSYTDNSFSYSTVKAARLYELAVTTDTPGDVLNIQYVLTNVSGASGSAHTLIAAVAVSAVPEPTALAGLGLLGVTLLTRRRTVTA